jgi:hypothetical protein
MNVRMVSQQWYWNEMNVPSKYENILLDCVKGFICILHR